MEDAHGNRTFLNEELPFWVQPNLAEDSAGIVACVRAALIGTDTVPVAPASRMGV